MVELDFLFVYFDFERFNNFNFVLNILFYLLVLRIFFVMKMEGYVIEKFLFFLLVFSYMWVKCFEKILRWWVKSFFFL